MSLTGDMAWIIGHSYAVYGPLVAGTTTVMYEGHPLYPQADRIWDMVDRHGVTILYTAPTIIRMLMRYGGQYPHMHDLSTLRLLATAGEGISREAWLWLHKHAGRSQSRSPPAMFRNTSLVKRTMLQTEA